MSRIFSNIKREKTLDEEVVGGQIANGQTPLSQEQQTLDEEVAGGQISNGQTPLSQEQKTLDGQVVGGQVSNGQAPLSQEQKTVDWTKEQERAITLRGKNIIVSASAGSGKTSVMIERAAGLIAEGHSISDMLIVTFTRAAAADIKDKLSRRLSASTDPHMRAQLKLLSGADIGTLHSWCQRLIGRYFYETGLDPDFAVLEGRESAAMFSESMDRVVDEEYAAESPDFLDFLEILGGRDEDNIKSQLQRFYYQLILRPNHEIRFDEGEAIERLKEIFAKKQTRLLHLAEQLYADLEAADYQKKLAPAAELFGCIKELKPPVLHLGGKIPEGLEELNDRLKELRADVKQLITEYNTAITAPPPSNEYLHVLLRMAKRLDEVFLGLKKSKSKADFNDLEHHALAILQSAAGAEVKNAYKFVFVDEYQDINPLQNSIIDALCGEGNLFLVGDLKQSIYAFRGCEPGIFARKIKAFEKDPACEVITLNANHRSVAGVLDFSNRVFSRIMTEDFGGTDYSVTGRFVIKNKAGAEQEGNNAQANKTEDSNQGDNNAPSNKDENLNQNDNNAQPNHADNPNQSDSNQGDDPNHAALNQSNPNQSSPNQGDKPNHANLNQTDNVTQSNLNQSDDSSQDVYADKKYKDYTEDKSVNIYLYKEEKYTKTGLYDLTKDEGESGDLTVDLALARILELLNKTITEKGETRGVRQSDIAVLCRKSSPTAFALISRLQKIGLCVNVCEKLKEAAGDELVALFEYLRLVDNRLFDRPLINSLKGHFGGFSDAELYEIRKAFPYAESFHAAAMAYISDGFANKHWSENKYNAVESSVGDDISAAANNTSLSAANGNITPNSYLENAAVGNGLFDSYINNNPLINNETAATTNAANTASESSAANNKNDIGIEGFTNDISTAKIINGANTTSTTATTETKKPTADQPCQADTADKAYGQTRGQIDENLKQRLSEFYKKLDYYRQLSAHISAEELVGKVVTDFEYFQAMFTLGEQSPRLLESFLDWAAGRQEGLSGLLEILPEKYASAGIAGDAISVITVHSSKGLEYPFVLVLNTEKKFNIKDLSRPIITLEGLSAIKHFDMEQKKSENSAVWLLNKQELGRRQREEEMRLLYVAITRGKYCVDIFGAALDSGKYKTAEEGNCWLDWLMPVAEDYVRVIRPAPAPVPKPAVFPPADPRLTHLLKDSFDFSVSAPTYPPKTYVTALLGGFNIPEEDEFAESIYLCDDGFDGDVGAAGDGFGCDGLARADSANNAPQKTQQSPETSLKAIYHKLQSAPKTTSQTIETTSRALLTAPELTPQVPQSAPETTSQAPQSAFETTSRALLTAPESAPQAPQSVPETTRQTFQSMPVKVSELTLQGVSEKNKPNAAQSPQKPTDGGAGEDAAELGTLYHKAMELVDFYSDFEGQWHSLDPQIKQRVDKAKIKTAAKIVGDYLVGYKILKEQGFIMDIESAAAGVGDKGSLLLQGVIDVLAIKMPSVPSVSPNRIPAANSANSANATTLKDCEAVIIDYKTGALSASYKKQLYLYALAAKKILGITKIKTLIYSFAGDKLVDSQQL